jgi:tetratricopeptide (TPR) repeat protein
MKHNRIVLLGAAVLTLASIPPAYGQSAAEEARQLAEKAQERAKAEKFDEAITLMKKALQLDPRNDEHLGRASLYEFKAGKFAEGLEHALQAVRLNDKVGAYHVLVAYNAVGEQDLELGRKHCELVLKRGPTEVGAEAYNEARLLQDVLVRKTYTLFWNLDPKKGRAVGATIAIALPKGDLPYQSVTFEISGAKSHRLVKGEVNDVLLVLPEGTRTIALTTKVTVEPHTFKKELARATKGPLPPEAQAFLGAVETIDPRSPAVTKVAARLRAGDTVSTVRNIVAWMNKNIEYKLKKNASLEVDFKSVDEILARGHAECRGYAMLFTALCRAAGVPARPVWGLKRVPPGQDKKFGDITSHNWAEFYVPGCGWVPVDPQRPETIGYLPTTCIRLFMDARKNRASTETLPLLNLIFMNGDKLKFEESR